MFLRARVRAPALSPAESRNANSQLRACSELESRAVSRPPPPPPRGARPNFERSSGQPGASDPAARAIQARAPLDTERPAPSQCLMTTRAASFRGAASARRSLILSRPVCRRRSDRTGLSRGAGRHWHPRASPSPGEPECPSVLPARRLTRPGIGRHMPRPRPLAAAPVRRSIGLRVVTPALADPRPPQAGTGPGAPQAGGTRGPGQAGSG